MLFAVAVLLFFSLNVFAQVQVQPIDNNPGTIAQINSIDQQVKELKARIDSLPSKQDIDSSFLQLDQKVSESSQSVAGSTLGLIVFGLVLNDIALIAFFIIGRGKGWI